MLLGGQCKEQTTVVRYDSTNERIDYKDERLSQRTYLESAAIDWGRVIIEGGRCRACESKCNRSRGRDLGSNVICINGEHDLQRVRTSCRSSVDSCYADGDKGSSKCIELHREGGAVEISE